MSKAIDKAAGAEREVVGQRDRYRDGRLRQNLGGTGGEFLGLANGVAHETMPATDAAREWQGFGTALKPAWEPIILARKPLIGTVVANVLAHGTGALNIDACRIEGEVPQVTQGISRAGANGTAIYGAGRGMVTERMQSNPHAAGRWPANVALDTEVAALLDEQSGERPSTGAPGRPASPTTYSNSTGYSGGIGLVQGPLYEDTGGASRFFYTAKASTSERNRGMPNGERNTHPTVKPVALMRWLVRLVTPPGGRVLDPFAGSGTTLVAAIMEGFTATGIERELEYVKIARARISGVQTGGLL